MKTMIFEKILLSHDDRGFSYLTAESHYGTQSIRMSPEEVDVLIAEMINHRCELKKHMDKLKAQENLNIEKMKRA